jgi:hypothetical protein
MQHIVSPAVFGIALTQANDFKRESVQFALGPKASNSKLLRVSAIASPLPALILTRQRGAKPASLI